MSDDCRSQVYYSCEDEPSYDTDVAGNSKPKAGHTIRHEYKIDLGFKTLYSINTVRFFSISASNSYTKTVYHVSPITCEGGSTPPCLSWCYERNDSFSATITEDCKIKKDTIYYLDMAKQIVFYKHEEESLEFIANGPDHTTIRQKFGNSEHNKLKIKGAKIRGKEQHILILNGEEKILNEVIYEREPGWMMGPIGIPNANSGVTMPTGCDAYDKDIQQIILWPIPPSKAIPMENEVRCLGFYDYGKDAPSGYPSDLYQKDGGNDFFYPSWCRSMLSDPYWASARTRRVDILWWHEAPKGLTTMYRPDILVDVVPKGNAVTHDVLGTMYAFTFRNRDGQEFSVAELEGEDPKQKIIDLGVGSYGDDWCYHPVSVV